MKFMTNLLVPVLRDPLRSLGQRLSADSALRRLTEREAPIVWHVAAPKTGSTWVTRVLGGGLEELGWTRAMFYTTGAGGYREQTLDRRCLISLDKNYGPVFGTHHHCPYSDYARTFIEEHQIRVILQVRNLFDALVSFKDHLDKQATVPMVFTTPEQWGQLSEEQRYQFVTELVAPWYIRFWAGWSQAMQTYPHLSIRLVHYESLLEAPHETFHSLARYCLGDEAVDEDRVAGWMDRYGANDTRKNKAVIGRGQTLPEARMERVRSWAALYPDTDFAPLGL